MLRHHIREFFGPQMAPKILCSINGNPQLMLRTSTANSGITPWYCCNVMKKHFNKELAMTKTDDQDFENSTKCWIYDIRPFIINYSFIIKMTTKNETRDAVIIWLFSEVLFHLFSFPCWRIKFLLSIFFF